MVHGVIVALQRGEYADAAAAVMAEPINIITMYGTFMCIQDKGCRLRDEMDKTCTGTGADKVCTYNNCIPGIWPLVIFTWVTFINTISFQLMMFFRCYKIGGQKYQEEIDKLKEKHPNADVDALVYYSGISNRIFAVTFMQFILSIFLIKDCADCKCTGGNAKAMLVFSLFSGLWGVYQLSVKYRHAKAGTKPEATKVGVGPLKFTILS
jgi:hypothetical protein